MIQVILIAMNYLFYDNFMLLIFFISRLRCLLSFFPGYESCYHCYHGLAIIDIILFQSKHSGSIFFYYVCLKLQFQESEALNFGYHDDQLSIPQLSMALDYNTKLDFDSYI